MHVVSESGPLHHAVAHCWMVNHVTGPALKARVRALQAFLLLLGAARSLRPSAAAPVGEAREIPPQVIVGLASVGGEV